MKPKEAQEAAQAGEGAKRERSAAGAKAAAATLEARERPAAHRAR